MIHKLKLLVDVAEGNVAMQYREVEIDGKPVRKPKRGPDGKDMVLKTIKRRNPAWHRPISVDGKTVECKEPEFLVTEFKAGAIVTTDDAGAKKFLERKLAEVVS